MPWPLVDIVLLMVCVPPPPGIVEHMGEQSGPPSKPVQAAKQVQELVKDGDDAVIVGVFSGDQDPAFEIYMEAC